MMYPATKYLAKITVCCLMLAATSAMAEKADRKVTFSAPASSRATGPMTVMSGSKIVKDILRKHHKVKQGENSSKVTINSMTSSANTGVRDVQKKKVVKKKKASEPIVIKLEVPKDLPPVVNKTKQFVFSDVTLRGEKVVGQQANLAKRTKNIETLRQVAAKR